MLKIDNISADSLQKQSLLLPDNSTVVLTLYFVPMQYGWFIRELTYGDFSIKNMRITNSPNMLYQYLNQIPFGLACVSTQDREPSLLEDFSTGASILYVLTEDEVQEYAEYIRGQV